MKKTMNNAWLLGAALSLASGSHLSADLAPREDLRSEVLVVKETPTGDIGLEAKREETGAPREEPVSPEKQTPPRANPDDERETLRAEIALENALEAEKSKKELASLQQQVARLKLEKELLNETLAMAELQEKQAVAKETAAFKRETAQLSREVELAKMEAEKISALLKSEQAAFGLALSEVEREVKVIEAETLRDNYARTKPVYLADPFLEDGTLVISDRRIDLNGPIFSGTAEHVAERINYFNNKNSDHPIFVVIDSSPGGSVMAGLSIQKAMEGSEAPVYVVVKTFAASMAASLTTMAERSFAFPNAIILHHQVLAGSYGNLSETREQTRQLEEWWRRLATPIAKKMGITREEFIKQMYDKTVTGDWTEFADEAQKLKWVDHIVTNLKETSLLKNPDAKKAASSTTKGSPAASNPREAQNLIPRLNPKDVLYLYNPDGFYQMQQ